MILKFNALKLIYEIYYSLLVTAFGALVVVVVVVLVVVVVDGVVVLGISTKYQIYLVYIYTTV